MLPIHLYKLRAGTKYWYHNTVFRFFVSKKFAKNIFKKSLFWPSSVCYRLNLFIFQWLSTHLWLSTVGTNFFLWPQKIFARINSWAGFNQKWVYLGASSERTWMYHVFQCILCTVYTTFRNVLKELLAKKLWLFS